IGFDFAQGIREHLGRECRVSNVEGFNIVGDQVVLARGLVKPAVTRVEDHGGGIWVGAGLHLEPCETVNNCGFGCGLVVDLPDVAIVARIGAEIGVDQYGPDRLDILDSDRKRPGRVGGLTDADQQCVALRECVGHGNYPLLELVDMLSPSWAVEVFSGALWRWHLPSPWLSGTAGCRGPWPRCRSGDSRRSHRNWGGGLSPAPRRRPHLRC